MFNLIVGFTEGTADGWVAGESLRTTNQIEKSGPFGVVVPYPMEKDYRWLDLAGGPVEAGVEWQEVVVHDIEHAHVALVIEPGDLLGRLGRGQPTVARAGGLGGQRARPGDAAVGATRLAAVLSPSATRSGPFPTGNGSISGRPRRPH